MDEICGRNCNMLDFLFNSEISFPKGWECESQLGNLVEAVQDLSAKIEALLGVEHLESWHSIRIKFNSFKT